MGKYRKCAKKFHAATVFRLDMSVQFSGQTEELRPKKLLVSCNSPKK